MYTKLQKNFEYFYSRSSMLGLFYCPELQRQINDTWLDMVCPWKRYVYYKYSIVCWLFKQFISLLCFMILLLCWKFCGCIFYHWQCWHSAIIYWLYKTITKCTSHIVLLCYNVSVVKLNYCFRGLIFLENPCNLSKRFQWKSGYFSLKQLLWLIYAQKERPATVVWVTFAVSSLASILLEYPNVSANVTISHQKIWKIRYKNFWYRIFSIIFTLIIKL